MLVVAAIWSTALPAQETLTPQTARQALLEMFFSKTPGTLVKHLPSVTRAALEKSGALASLQQYSLLANQLQTQGTNFQTFETGSVLLSGEDPKTGQKMEVTVENDALRGDQDDIELSFQTYKNGEAQRTPFMPRMTFSMKQESHIWKLNEISVTVRLPRRIRFTEGVHREHEGAGERKCFLSPHTNRYQTPETTRRWWRR